MNTPSLTHQYAWRELQQCDSAETLTPALRRLCSGFGSVENLVILTARHEGTKQAICFLRLASDEQEQMLMQTLGVVDLKASAPNPEFQNNFYWRSNSTSSVPAFQAA